MACRPRVRTRPKSTPTIPTTPNQTNVVAAYEGEDFAHCQGDWVGRYWKTQYAILCAANWPLDELHSPAHGAIFYES